jgi:hypothetical protein
MSILTTILIILAIIIVMILIIAAFISEDSIVEREIIINKSRNEVFSYIRYLKNQDYYSKWVMTDPGMKKEFRGTDGTVGFVYAWDSENKNAGKGEQEITKLSDGHSMECEIRFEKPFIGTSYAYFTTESVADEKTKVKWVFAGKLNYMMKIMHLLLNLKKMLGKDIEMSLNDLKSVLEK